MHSAALVRTNQPHRAFTLIEMVLVLVVMAILATVAVEMVEPRVDETRYRTTVSTLENISDAVRGSQGSRQSDGTPIVTGFVADIGRLPKLSIGVAGEELSELWKQGELPPSDVYVVGPTHSVVQDGEAEAKGMSLQVGYRGPYLTLPIGASLLRDGWGNYFDISFSTAPNSEDELSTIQSKGGPASPYDSPLPDPPLAFTSDQYQVSFIVRVEKQTGAPIGDAKLFLAEPDVEAETDDNFIKVSKGVNMTGGNYKFDDVTIGGRLLRVVASGYDSQDIPLTVYPRMHSFRTVLSD